MKITELCELANKYKTDKGPIKHNYTEKYFEFFHNIREQPINLLEIGVAFGASIRMWLEFFPNAKIYGIDKEKMFVNLDDPRFTFIQGNQHVDTVYDELFKHCTEFDIIIDDGSHKAEDELYSFDKLFINHLKLDGIYVIEDLHTLRTTEIMKTIDVLDIFANEGYFHSDHLSYFSNFVLTNSINKCKIYNKKIAFITKKEFKA